MFKQRVLLCSAARYSITENGRTNEGVSVTYLSLDSRPADTPDKKGNAPVSATMPLEQWPAFRAQTLPAVYELDMDMTEVKRAGSNKTVQGLTPVYATYIGNVDLRKLGQEPDAPAASAKVAGNGANNLATAGAAR